MLCRAPSPGPEIVISHTFTKSANVWGTRSLVEDADLQEGDTLSLAVRNGAIVAKPVRKKLALKDLLAEISPENIHGQIDWGEPRGKEVW
jgi:antitoxin MazE